MNNAITVSVIIPTHNRAELVLRAVQSVLAQRDVRTEIIVVDDGSTDNTIEMLEALNLNSDANIKIITQSNSGASAARNRGLKSATGEYIQFLDSDDTLSATKLAVQSEALASNPDASASFCYGWLQQEGRERQIGLNLGSEPAAYIEALCGPEVHIVPTLSPLWKRDILESNQWNEDISLGDDLEFTIRCLLDAKRIAFVEETLFKVHEHRGDRLSNFSTDDVRLSSLITTRMTICELLKTRSAWNEKCAEKMSRVFHSLYFLALQRFSATEVRKFDSRARSILGNNWKTPTLMVFSTMRRICGRGATRLFMQTARFTQKPVTRAISVGAWRRWLTRRAFRLGVLRSNEPSTRNALETLLKVVPEKPTVLYVEGNKHHAELIPGYTQLLLDAGYDVVVVTRVGVDGRDALVRIPKSGVAGVFELNIQDIKRFFRSGVPRQYELTVFGSATLVEPDFFVFEGLIDFIGRVPKAKRGNVVIEHAAESMLARKDKLLIEQQFALRSMNVGTYSLPMLAPVSFGEAQPAVLSRTVTFLVVGRLEADMRDVQGLFSAVRGLMRENGRPFLVNLVGGTRSVEIPTDIRECFNVLGYLSFSELYDTIERSHFLLPLLNSKTESHRTYLSSQTTGTRQLSLGFNTPMVMDVEFASANGFDDHSAITYEPGDLLEGMTRARHIAADDLTSLQTALKLMKAEVHADSLKNLQSFLTE